MNTASLLCLHVCLLVPRPILNIFVGCSGFSYKFTQHALIDAIINDVGLKDAKVKLVPAKVSLKLNALKDEPPFDLDFNYRSAVGKLNYF